MSRRVLVVSQHYKPENFRINDIVPKLVEDGFDVDVLCGLPNYPDGVWSEGYSEKGPFEEQDGSVTIYRAKEIPRIGNTSIRIFLNYVSWPVYAWLKAGKLPRDYDVVFCYNTSPVLMCWPANKMARLCNAKLVTYVLDIWPENLYTVLNIKNKFLRRMLSRVSDRAYARADALITMSDSLKSVLQKRLGDAVAHYDVIPQHAEDFYAEQLPANQDFAVFAKCDCLLVFTGSLTPAQNIDGVIESVIMAREKSGKDIRLLLVGDGMSRADLEDLVSALDASAYVAFVGRVDAKKIPSFSKLADAMVLSLSEDPALELVIPAKVASYMAAAKPIVGSLNGEGAQAIENAECGLVAAAGDKVAFANAIIEFASTDADQRRQYGNNAFEYYQQNFARDKVISMYEDLLR